MSERIRLTITVTPEVHQIFSNMADAAGISLGKCMGEWLADTADGAQFVALKMQEARKAPKTVMREMQASVRGLAEEVDSTLHDIRLKSQGEGRAAKAQPRGASPRTPSPPSSNTGGKVPQENPKKSAGRRS
jgi:hypothetical protein